MTHGLANVFVNNQRVEDLDDPELKIRDIIAAYGRDPSRCIVYRMEGEEAQGNPVDLDERIDLAQIAGTLHLRCETKRTEATAPSPPEESESSEADDYALSPGVEGTLGDQETVETLDAEEREQNELLSPETGAHQSGDPTGHQFYEREPAPRWGQANEGTTMPPADRKPSALGSEIRSPPRSRRPSTRSMGARARRRGETPSPSTSSTRTSSARRKKNTTSGTRRAGR